MMMIIMMMIANMMMIINSTGTSRSDGPDALPVLPNDLAALALRLAQSSPSWSWRTTSWSPSRRSWTT